MAKRGRPRKNNLYFSDIEEDAVKRYLSTEDQYEREAIYNECLRYALDKLVECISGFLAKKWGKQRILGNEEYSFIHNDTLSFLTTVQHRFNPEKGTKSYSFYGTCCKNYILGLMIAREKGLNKSANYDEFINDIDENAKLSYNIDEIHKDPDSLIKDSALKIQKELDKNKESNNLYLTENEKRVGESLIFILNNWRDIVNAETNNKYYRNIIYGYLREMCILETKDICLALKKYKNVYKSMINDKIKEGEM